MVNNLRRFYRNMWFLFFLACSFYPATLWASPQQNIDQLYYQDTVFNFQKGDFFTAITGLKTAQHLGKTQYTKRDFELLLANAQLAYGMPDVARTIFEKYPEHSPLEMLSRNQARWMMAEIYYGQGNADKALQALQSIQGKLASLEVEDKKNILEIRILAHQKRMAEAMEVFNLWQQGAHGSPIWKYNAAIFLLDNKYKKKGIKLLQEFSQSKVSRRGAVNLALKNEANLLLAKLLYNDSKYHEAAGYSLKIWEESFYFNRAQMILGETVLNQRKYREAITEWQRMDTQVIDESVQRALLNIPQAYLRLQENVAAEQAYKKAIAALERGKKQLQFLRRAIKKEPIVECFFKDRPLPQFSLYLLDELSQKSMLTSIENYSQVSLLEQALYDWKNTLSVLEKNSRAMSDTEAKARINQRLDAQKQRIKKLYQRALVIKKSIQADVSKVLLEALSLKEKRINAHLGRAWYGLASLHDRQLAQKGGE